MTRVYVDKNVQATRYLDTYAWPNDITLLSSQISGLILQADFDATDSASLTRNRVGTTMSVVGSPELSGYGATLSEGNYLNTGIDISAYNASDLTMIAILTAPVDVTAIMGRIQLNAPQRSRGLRSTGAGWVAAWLNSAGAGILASTAFTTPVDTSEFVAARFIVDSGTMSTKVKTPRNSIESVQNASATPYSMPSSQILLGASIDAVGATSIFMRSALIANRALTDDEISLIYRTYKNYYSKLGISL